ncbi:conserved membrane hypothetical protein [Candidatus Desulfarcum epimagneticum]|uniref:Tetratricopeptide repeat protein n=1 Tax=uncultured Desulfobacteraceae bacterium TaxID=218296 RepID=A0A484HMY2_9BACT|nr:conserved membrane hypothetical protein [uncultured Desulfobacteraceae bacterium]
MAEPDEPIPDNRIVFKQFVKPDMDNLKKHMTRFPLISQALLFVTIVMGVWGVYAGALGGGFVLDDWSLILHNPTLRIQDLSWSEIQRIVVGLRPVSTLTFALNHLFFPESLAAYHAVNIVIHIAAGIFLFFFVQITLGLSSAKAPSGINARFSAYAVSILWLFHPVNTQSVSYIVQRQNAMAGMFFIASMLFYAKARLAPKPPNARLWAAGCALAGVLAVGSKENAAALPVFIFLYEWFFFQDLNAKWAAIRGLSILGALAVALASVWIFFPQILPMGILSRGYDIYAFTMEQRLLTELRVLVYYITLIFFPHPSRLSLDRDFPYSHSMLDPPTTLASLLILLALLGLAAARARKEPLFSFCVIWFFGNLVMESSFIPLDIIFEHRLYLPSISIIGMAAWALWKYLPSKKAVAALFCLALSAFSIWTWQRNQVWGKSPMAIYLDSAAKSPEKARPFYNVACEYAKRGRAREAVRWLELAKDKKKELKWSLERNLSLDPDFKAIRRSRAFKEFAEKISREK